MGIGSLLTLIHIILFRLFYIGEISINFMFIIGYFLLISVLMVVFLDKKHKRVSYFILMYTIFCATFLIGKFVYFDFGRTPLRIVFDFDYFLYFLVPLLILSVVVFFVNKIYLWSLKNNQDFGLVVIMFYIMGLSFAYPYWLFIISLAGSSWV